MPRAVRCLACGLSALLLTDDEPGQRAFYESLGYTEIRDHVPGTLRAFVRFDDGT